jgi:hypothetical protein
MYQFHFAIIGLLLCKLPIKPYSGLLVLVFKLLQIDTNVQYTFAQFGNLVGDEAACKSLLVRRRRQNLFEPRVA